MKEERPFYQERIVTDPRILAGKPVIKGTRIGVDLVLEELAHNPDIKELLAAHPDLTRDDVQACLAYAQAIVTGEDVWGSRSRRTKNNDVIKLDQGFLNGRNPLRNCTKAILPTYTFSHCFHIFIKRLVV